MQAGPKPVNKPTCHGGGNLTDNNLGALSQLLSKSGAALTIHVRHLYTNVRAILSAGLLALSKKLTRYCSIDEASTRPARAFGSFEVCGSLS
jgi:hypothetical protein